MCEVSAYRPPSWYTREGIWKKKRQIESRGIPDLTNCRFITLTMNQDLYSGPRHAYECGKDRIKHFAKAFMSRIGGSWYCCKFEFQENGWPHWHLCIDHRRKLTLDQMDIMEECWTVYLGDGSGLVQAGFTNVKRIEGRKLNYMFKYLYKPPKRNHPDFDVDDEPPILVPDWFADWRDPITGETYDKARFWTTSRNFYTNDDRNKNKESHPKQGCKNRPLTVRERHFEWYHSAVITIDSGSVRESLVVELTCPWSHLVEDLNKLRWSGKVVSSPFNGYVLEKHAIPINRIRTNIESWLKKDKQQVNHNQTLPQQILRNRPDLRQLLELEREELTPF
jgi:hypothetical protein